MKNKTIKFNKEEKEILDAIDKDLFVSEPLLKKEMEQLKTIAKNTFAKTRSINIRISERDLLKIKAKSAYEGMPYQTFISSTLHKEAENLA